MIRTNPLLKIRAAYNNPLFDRNKLDLLVAMVLLVDNETNEKRISHSLFQTRTRMSITTIKKAVRELSYAGVITILDRGNNLTNLATLYRLNPEVMQRDDLVFEPP